MAEQKRCQHVLKHFNHFLELKPLRTTGEPPIDGRRKHTNRPHKMSQQTRELLLRSVGSLKGRKYSLKDYNRVYLPENMNAKKLLALFLTKQPHIEMCYETFRQIFVSEFNIAFGYPRTETCCWCDEQKAKITELDRKIAAEKSDDKKVKLDEEGRKLETEKTLHLKRADWFYELKRRTKTEAIKSSTVEAIAIDFGKISLLQI
ncbi:unnamed protein product [Psylliodes chrysocephalus]|uniref:Uncharacterized protein n=1 Tax=Psylliodes chrysocephalus TaxID=3402493 RepID=A0A9P0CMZ3_9CUCU|nr:unnamed protein product [Psylliodes chrysocephala]